MIHWIWLVPVSLVSVIAGFFSAALCKQSRNDIEEE